MNVRAKPAEVSQGGVEGDVARVVTELVARARAAQRAFEFAGQDALDTAADAAAWAIMEPERNRLLASKDVADVVSRFDEVDIAIVGIGILEPSQLLKTSGNYYHEDMLQVLAARGAVGDICLHYYDKNGHPVLRDDEDPVIGMALEKVKKCPNVVALAGGTDKVAAIKGALTGGYIDVLITDYPTARMLVSD